MRNKQIHNTYISENKFQKANTKAVMAKTLRNLGLLFQKNKPAMVNKTTLIIAAGSGLALKMGFIKSGNLFRYIEIKV